MTDPFDIDRDRGMLTAKDRAFLAEGGTAENANTERQKWYRIRSRVRNGIIDFSALFEEMNDEQRNKALTQEKSDTPKTARDSRGVDIDFSHPSGLPDGMRDAVGLFYLTFLEDNPARGHEMFEAMIEASVKRALEREGGVVKVDVSISKEQIGETPEEVINRWVSAMTGLNESTDDLPEELDTAEVGVELIKSGHIDPPEEWGDNLPNSSESDE